MQNKSKAESSKETKNIEPEGVLTAGADLISYTLYCTGLKLQGTETTFDPLPLTIQCICTIIFQLTTVVSLQLSCLQTPYSLTTTILLVHMYLAVQYMFSRSLITGLKVYVYVDATFASCWGTELGSNPDSVKSHTGYIVEVMGCSVI